MKSRRTHTESLSWCWILFAFLIAPRSRLNAPRFNACGLRMRRFGENPTTRKGVCEFLKSKGDLLKQKRSAT